MKRKTGKTASRADAVVREHVVHLLKGGNAHVGFDDAVEKLPAKRRGTFAKGLAHTPWQLLEHLRITQWDILEFTRNPMHVSPEFPEGYWPEGTGPESDAAWQRSVQRFREGQKAMIALVKNPRTDLYAKLPHGHGQTALQEALLLADHNAYHIAQMVDVRRALGCWPHE